MGTKTLLHWQKSKQIYFGYKKEIPNGDENWFFGALSSFCIII